MARSRPDKVDHGKPSAGTKMAIYCRTASSDADIDEQESHLRQFAERHEWQILSSFHDRGQSGLSRDREGLKHLCAHLLRPDRAFNHILTTTPSRISRDPAHYNELYEILRDSGVVIVFSQVPTGGENNASLKELATIFGVFTTKKRKPSQAEKPFHVEDEQ
jgi:DNA invertase Pin-like site-specific DNA recombinase